MRSTQSIQSLSTAVIERAFKHGLKVTTAESCTGGMIAAALTDIPGSSSVFERGFVTYSNEAKEEMLNVPSALINTHGAVSREVAQAMAQGALAHSNADIAVSVTGIAGPTGGSAGKPVGLVWFGLAQKDHPVWSERRLFSPASRVFIRLKTVEAALTFLLTRLPRS